MILSSLYISAGKTEILLCKQPKSARQVVPHLHLACTAVNALTIIARSDRCNTICLVLALFEHWWSKARCSASSNAKTMLEKYSSIAGQKGISADAPRQRDTLTQGR